MLNCQRSIHQVRVRFAPSPTGHIHLGGLRTALYNYVFAKQHGGQFVLRIEDTDQTRVVPGSAQEIEHLLHWAGLKPDESPTLGGPYGPYEQSRRLNLYKQHADQLLTQGKAYRCFCSPTRLDLLRKFQARNREKIRYDGKCRSMTQSEIDEKLHAHDNRHVIRFSLREGQHSFDDLIFGSISANLVEALESDPIILKSDHYPTYHFASVIDDHHMRISHVLRGSEWISSTIKHVQLYRAFHWSTPTFAHIPLITMHDGAKMSKRNDHSHVKSWIEAGYQPGTLFNFLTNSGGGVPKSKQDAMDFWTLDELIKGFNFKQVTCHPSSLDMNRLHVYSAKELQRTWSEDPKKVLDRFARLLEEKKIETDLEITDMRSLISLLIDRLTSVNDLLSHDYVFLWRQPDLTWPKEEYSKWNTSSIIKDITDLVDSVDIKNKRQFNEALKEMSNQHNIEYGEFMKFIRKIFTNSEKGLPVHEIFCCLSRKRLKQYLCNGLDYLES